MPLQLVHLCIVLMFGLPPAEKRMMANFSGLLTVRLPEALRRLAAAWPQLGLAGVTQAEWAAHVLTAFRAWTWLKQVAWQRGIALLPHAGAPLARRAITEMNGAHAGSFLAQTIGYLDPMSSLIAHKVVPAGKRSELWSRRASAKQPRKRIPKEGLPHQHMRQEDGQMASI
jgi:hypothetical protein